VHAESTSASRIAIARARLTRPEVRAVGLRDALTVIRILMPRLDRDEYSKPR
jgi:hypothetical protein